METSTLLEKYASLSPTHDKKAKLIKKICENNKECGDLLDWDYRTMLENIINEGNTKMTAIANRLSTFKTFFDYLIENAVVKENPIVTSYFSTEMISNYILYNDKLDFYSKDFLENKIDTCYNKPYYKSLIYSLFYGIDGVSTLSKIKYDDVDFENRIIKPCNLSIPEELCGYYKDMYAMKNYETDQVDQEFDNNSDLLMRQVISRGRSSASCKTPMVMLSSKISDLGLKTVVICDSGTVYRLVEKIGKQEFINLLYNTKGMPKMARIEKNKKLNNVLEELQIRTQINRFVFDYRIYAEALFYGIIDL